MQGEKIIYTIPWGLSGSLEVHAIASNRKGKLLDLVWSVTAAPIGKPNKPHVITIKADRKWVAAGQTLRMVVRVSDPDGDSLYFYNRFPARAIYHDSVLEWTPTPDQWRPASFVFDVYDAYRNHEAAEINITVLSYDPTPYLADLSEGRAWWIHGYEKMMGSGTVDSTYFAGALLSLDGMRLRGI